MKDMQATIRKLRPYSMDTAAAVKGEIVHVPVAGSSAGPLHQKEEVETEGESSNENESDSGGVYREVRKLLDEETTLSTLTKEAASKMNKLPLSNQTCTTYGKSGLVL